MSKLSKGWRVNLKGCMMSHGLPTIDARNGHLVAFMADTNLVRANVISAAPELLEALEGLAEAYASLVISEFQTGSNPNPCETDENLTRARAAIAKAKGL